MRKIYFILSKIIELQKNLELKHPLVQTPGCASGCTSVRCHRTKPSRYRESNSDRGWSLLLEMEIISLLGTTFWGRRHNDTFRDGKYVVHRYTGSATLQYIIYYVLLPFLARILICCVHEYLNNIITYCATFCYLRFTICCFSLIARNSIIILQRRCNGLMDS